MTTESYEEISHMKLSIVIPFHKYKHYLKECFASLLESKFQDFECVLVLDHVEESIDDILAAYQDKLTIRSVVMSDGNGVGAARNRGIEESSGTYIYFLDSDDYVLEDTLGKLFEEGDAQVHYGTIHNTWNMKLNYLEKMSKKLEDVSEDELLEKEERKLKRYLNFKEKWVDAYDDFKLDAVYYLFKRRKGFRQITILGNAYQRDFLMDCTIRFDEELTYYSDLVFLMNVLKEAQTLQHVEQSIYVKRKHNDPINYPALRQINDDNRFAERMLSYQKARAMLRPDGLLRYLLDRKIVTYYLHSFSPRLRRSEKSEWRKVYFPLLSEVMKDTREDVIDNLKGWQRRMVRALQRGDLSKVLRQVRFRLAKKKLKKMKTNKNVFYKLAYYHLFLKKPLLQNVVLFESFNAKNYSDSPKYIYEYLAQHHSDQYTFVWALNSRDKKLPYGGKVVHRFSFRYAYYLARSKYLVFNVRQPLWYRKREGQVFVETWHGTPLKRLVFDQEEVTAASPKYKQQFYKQRSDWDYLVSANDFSTETLRRCFMYEGEMLDVGYPRNDILYAPDKEEKARMIREKLHIPKDKKTILYAPTWRDDEYYGKGQYKFTLQLDLARLQREVSDAYVILLRTHQYIADAIDTTGLEGFAFNVSSYDDISELYLISDVCITDYSSVFFDYANLKRPILFYTYDIDKYKNQLRGFYIDMNTEIPGPLLYTNDDVIHALKHMDEVEAQYHECYEQFYQRFCHLDDGFASKNIVERVFLT